jgi:hypothetical protein
MKHPCLAALIIAPSLAAVGCAGSSGYSVDMRNNTGRLIRVDMMSQVGDKEPTNVGTSQLSGGANATLFTKADRKAKVTLVARPEGDMAGEPARMPLTLGLTQVDIIPNDRASREQNAPRIRIRTRD